MIFFRQSKEKKNSMLDHIQLIKPYKINFFIFYPKLQEKDRKKAF